MILAVPLMGSDCAVAARVGGPPPPQDDTDPPPNNGGGGGVIIVATGDSALSGASAASVRSERELVASALAVSVWTPPDLWRAAASSTILEPTTIRARAAVVPMERETGSVLPVEIVAESSSPAVPEPAGIVLFAAGLWVASSVVRAVGAGGRPG